MPNLAAVALALTILAAVLADALLNAGEATLFLLQKLVAAVEWLVFWH